MINPLLVFLVVFVLVLGGAAIILRGEILKEGGIKKWVSDFPTTPGRIFVSIMLAVFYVVIAMLLTVLAAISGGRIELPNEVLRTLAFFLLIMMGIDVAAYSVKRLTQNRFADDPPRQRTRVEAATQTTTTTTTEHVGEPEE